jgi:hypothetical protein
MCVIAVVNTQSELGVFINASELSVGEELLV